MMRKSTIAKRYANAAILNITHDKYEEVLQQLHNMKRLIKETPEVISIIVSAMVHRDEKIGLINALFENVDNKDFWAQMFKVLILKKRSNIINEFLFEFEQLLDKAINQKNVKLQLAFEHDEETLNVIKKEVGKILNCKVNFTVHIDKDIIAGFIAMSDTKYIDASLRTNIERFAIKRKKL